MALSGRARSGRLTREAWLVAPDRLRLLAAADGAGLTPVEEDEREVVGKEDVEAPGRVDAEPFLTRTADCSGALRIEPESAGLEVEGREDAEPSREGFEVVDAAVVLGVVDERPFLAGGLAGFGATPTPADMLSLGLTGSPVRASTGSGVVGVVNATIFSVFLPSAVDERLRRAAVEATPLTGSEATG